MIINKFQRFSDPISTAQALFVSIENPSFPLDIEKIAKNLGIQEIQDLDDENFVGMLVSLPDKTAGYISVSTIIREQKRRRFTIAHELGHFLLTNHKGTFSCTKDDLTSFNAKKGSQETEANIFAANLLMPQKVFSNEMGRKDPSMSLFNNLTEYFGASLTATLIRYKELSDEPVAIVLSNEKGVKWATRSDNFEYFIPDSVPLSEESIAIEFFRGNDVGIDFQEVDKDTWFDVSQIHHHLIVKELAIPSPFYNEVISVLWLEEDEEEIEECALEFDGYLKIKDSG